MLRKDISIIIPTYNEKDNIKILFDRIDKSLKHLNYEIIVVDDDSPDRTADVVKNYIQNYPVKLIVRENDKGLATAVVEGFKYANSDILVIMDGDLQHPPEKLILLIWEAQNGSDIAIGSRYVEEDDKGFGEFNLTRKIISKGANVLAKVLFPKLPNIKDIQSGFFALKKDVIENTNLDPIGYKILLEILVMGNYNHVKEIPYVFGKRESGESKLGIKVTFDYIFHLLNLYWRKRKEMKESGKKDKNVY